jgi:hypothetical protein
MVQPIFGIGLSPHENVIASALKDTNMNNSKNKKSGVFIHTLFLGQFNAKFSGSL